MRNIVDIMYKSCQNLRTLKFPMLGNLWISEQMSPRLLTLLCILQSCSNHEVCRCCRGEYLTLFGILILFV